MAKKGLYANIHAKRERIKRGSGERMRRPGSKGAPTEKDFKDASKTVKEDTNLEVVDFKYKDVKPLNPEDKEYALEVVNTYADSDYFYVSHYNVRLGRHVSFVSDSDVPFMTYEKALEFFNKEKVINDRHRVELIFSSGGEDGDTESNESDNLVVNYKGAGPSSEDFEKELEEARLSKGMTIEDIAEKHGVSIRSIELQIEKGIKVEMEHTDNEEEAKRVAMDHLVEIPDYYNRLDKMEKDANKDLQEKKNKKQKVRDYNAKAMWGRVKKQVFKAKKGKGSFSRKTKHGSVYESMGLSLTEGTANFRSIGNIFPLLVWMDDETVWSELHNIATEQVHQELGEKINEITEDEILTLIEDKTADLMEDYNVAILDEEQIEELKKDIEGFNDDFISKFNWDEKVVHIEYGYYSGAQLFANPKYLNEEQRFFVDAFLQETKQKFYLTELGVSGTFSSGETTYNIKSSGKGLTPVDLTGERPDELEDKKEESKEKEDTDLDEELIAPSDEVVEQFLSLLKENGYDIESKKEYGQTEENPGAYDVHIQIKSKENKFTEENFEQEYERISDLINEFDPTRKYHITYSFGLMDDGYATAGLDIRRWWWDESDVVSLSGEKSIDLTEAKIQGETIEQFMERIKNITGKEPTKVIEAVTTLTEAKVDIDRFVAWGGQELYDRFVKLKPRLKTPENDVTYWTSTKNPRKPEELEQKLVELEGTKTKSQLDSEAREGAELIAENDSFLVYHIKNFEASKKYGKNTTWCVAGSKQWVRNDMQPNQYWDRYTQDQGVKFYYFIRKDNTDKYAFTMYPSGSRQVFNAKNHTLNRGELSKELANAPYVPNVFTPPGYRQKKNLPKLKNARQIGYTFTSLEDYVVSGDLAIEFRRKTKGTAIIPQEIKGIEDLCFAGKPELTEVLIHKGVDYVGVYAFAGCKNLTINCELANKPAGWEDEWNPDGCTVVWGYKPEGKEEEPEDDIQDVNIVARI
jgi:stalled ribosome alternative rescue factor ArfA